MIKTPSSQCSSNNNKWSSDLSSHRIWQPINRKSCYIHLMSLMSTAIVNRRAEGAIYIDQLGESRLPHIMLDGAM